MASDAVGPLEVSAGDKHLNPQWSKDDNEIYFIGDPEGIANVMRLCLETNAVHQITNVATAVAGITPTGPALSVSANERTLAFTIYANGRSRLIVVDPDEVLAGARALSATESHRDAEPRRHREPRARRLRDGIGECH